MDHHLRRVIKALSRDLATPMAAKVQTLVDKSEWTDLLKIRVRPQDYEDSESFFKDSVLVELLRKIEDLPTDVDREEAARATFWSCEAQNRTTNVRLTRYLPETLYLEDPQDERVYRFITEWRKDVNYILGNLPDHLTPRFSGGATYGDAGNLTTTPDKMSNAPQITEGARCLLTMWGDTAWSRHAYAARPWYSDPLTVRGNVFFTVPKDAEKRRGCCKEPSINVSYQLDVGRLMRNKLRARTGVDLKAGQQKHRRLARDASVTGDYATIDMSNASDTVCRLLPRLILRDDWHSLLDSLRCSHTRVDGKWVRLEKFSSMGNGFTFELESLLFATLARTIVRLEGGDYTKVSTYGDDLIVETKFVAAVIAALEFFGFTINRRKSFWEGPFRESCGGDFFDGVPVRAHYLEKLPDEPQQWISLANGIRRMAFSDPSTHHRWEYLRTAWLRALDPIPTSIRRCRGPEHLGDIVIHDLPEFWDVRMRTTKEVTLFDKTNKITICEKMGIPMVRCYRPVSVVLPWHYWTPNVMHASALAGCPSDGITPRKGGKDVTTGYKLDWTMYYGVEKL